MRTWSLENEIGIGPAHFGTRTARLACCCLWSWLGTVGRRGEPWVAVVGLP